MQRRCWRVVAPMRHVYTHTHLDRYLIASHTFGSGSRLALKMLSMSSRIADLWSDGRRATLDIADFLHAGVARTVTLGNDSCHSTQGTLLRPRALPHVTSDASVAAPHLGDVPLTSWRLQPSTHRGAAAGPN